RPPASRQSQSASTVQTSTMLPVPLSGTTTVSSGADPNEKSPETTTSPATGSRRRLLPEVRVTVSPLGSAVWWKAPVIENRSAASVTSFVTVAAGPGGGPGGSAVRMPQG